MEIQLNNRAEILKENELTISELLKVKNYTFKLMVIKINGTLVKKNEYNSAKVVDGDNVHIIHMISGG